MPGMQEELLQRVITDSRAYGTLLGSGAIGDSGKSAPAPLCSSHITARTTAKLTAA